MVLLDSFEQYFSTPAEVLVRAPGRVNLLGEHVDYNDGPVLPVALDRTVRLAAAATSGSTISLNALDLGERVSFSLNSLDEKIDLDGRPLPEWARYPAGVAWSLQDSGLRVHGAKVAYTSNLPIGAGLGSSAAVEVAFAVLWQSLGGWDADRLTLARLCQRAENDYMGVSSGLMDQFASACGVEGHALYLDTRSLEWHPVPFPPGIAIVIADSGVHRTLNGSEYNQRVAACQQAVELLAQHLPDMRSLRDISPVEFAAYSTLLPPLIRRRAEHVVKEIARVHSAVNSLRGDDPLMLGALMFSGHASLRDLYQVSTPELDFLVDTARELPGCLGARLTGAGFGGCTVNLVEDAHAAKFIQGLQDAYQQKTGRRPPVYLCRASAAATVTNL